MTADPTGVPDGRGRRTPAGGRIGDEPLGLERGDDRRVDPVGQLDDPVTSGPGRRCPTMMTGRFCARRSSVARGQLGRRRHDLVRCDAPLSRSIRRLVEARELLHLVGKDRGGQRRGSQRRASRQGPPARSRSRARGRSGSARSRRRTRRQAGTSWNAPGPSTCVCTWPVSARIGARSTFASQRPVSRFVAPGPAIEKHAAGPARELGVTRRRERRRALVADADEPQAARLLGPAKRLGEAQVGMADHAEHGVDPPARRARRRPGPSSVTRSSGTGSSTKRPPSRSSTAYAVGRVGNPSGGLPLHGLYS